MADQGKSNGPSVQLSTAGSHTLTVVKMVWLRIALQDMHGAPLKNRKYKLTLNEKGGNREISATTTAQGRVEQQICVGTVEGRLEVWLEDDLKCTYALNIGHFLAASSDVGFKSRLNNLGFDCGGTQGDPDATEQATRGFQRKHKLPVTGENDDATRSRLVQLHGV